MAEVIGSLILTSLLPKIIEGIGSKIGEHISEEFLEIMKNKFKGKDRIALEEAVTEIDGVLISRFKHKVRLILDKEKKQYKLILLKYDFSKWDDNYGKVQISSQLSLSNDGNINSKPERYVLAQGGKGEIIMTLEALSG